MKKIFLVVCLLMFSVNLCLASDVKINEYLDKSYVGISYDEAFSQKLPLILIFGNPNDIFSIVKMVPVAEVVYNDFKGIYNFCIINIKKDENKELVEYFNPQKFPAAYIIDPQTMLYRPIPRKYYNKKDIKKYLTEMKNGIH